MEIPSSRPLYNASGVEVRWVDLSKNRGPVRLADL